MERTVENASCPFLERLPSELRLHIYGFVYEDRIACVVPLLSNRSFLRGNDRVAAGLETHMLALLKTCKTIREEASPLFFDKVYFHFKLTSESLCLPLGMNSSFEQCHFFHRIQRLGIKTKCSDLAEFRLRLLQLQKIFEVLESVEASIKIVFSVYDPRDHRWYGFVDEANQLVAERVERCKAAGAGQNLFCLTLQALRDQPLRPPGTLDRATRVVI